MFVVAETATSATFWFLLPACNEDLQPTWMSNRRTIEAILGSEVRDC